jgi:hypothetical protein
MSNLIEEINKLQNGQPITVLIRPDYRSRDGIITGTVRKGSRHFYIVPAGDSHPGSSITKEEIISIII